jgi:hypothetical protein
VEIGVNVSVGKDVNVALAASRGVSVAVGVSLGPARVVTDARTVKVAVGKGMRVHVGTGDGAECAGARSNSTRPVQ